MVGIASILTIVSTISYAYFSSPAVTQKIDSNLSTATLALRFADNDNGIDAKLDFDKTVTKKFIIENTGTADASLSLNWHNLINTYTNGSLTYRLTYSTDENGTYTEIYPKSNVPVSTEATTQTMVGELSVPVKETYYYNLEVTLNYNQDVDQTSDLNASFSTNFRVEQPTRYKYYKLQINPNGGTWKEFSSTQEYLMKNGETKDIEKPQRVGYTFTGWSLKGISSTMEDSLFTMGMSDVVLEANWILNKYTLTIDADGGNYEGNTIHELDYNSNLTVLNPIKEGYTFTGWTIDGGTLNGTTYTMSEAKDSKLTAKWQVNNYKYIIYHNQMNVDGRGYTLVSADTDEKEAPFNTTVRPSVKTYTGFTSPDIQSLTIKAETAYPPVANRINYNYDRNLYNLTVNLNGGNATGIPNTMYYDATITLPIPAKKGYNFTNWTATGGTLDDNDFTISDSDVSLTANYTAQTFSVTFNANGGNTPTTSKIVTYDSTYEDLPTPTYQDYEFLGWFTESDGGTEISSNTKVDLDDDQTLFAHWKKKQTTIVDKIIASSHGVKDGYDDPATTDEGIFEMEDDYGTSYYYRGAVENNYVKFAGFYWRIIRINGDGSLRIIYDGTKAHANGTNDTDRFTHTSQPYNELADDAKYFGWMYGPSNAVEGKTTASTSKVQAQTNIESSDAKKLVDEWYKANIEDAGYGSAAADVLFCNDRSIPGKAVSLWTYDTELGYGRNYTAYGGLGRYITGNNSTSLSGKKNVQPIFKCPEKNDSFTVSDKEKGNGALTYPVGLITADEIVAAGSGKNRTENKSYYLYKGNRMYWTLSPRDYSSFPYLLVIDFNGVFSAWGVQGEGSIAPVINLSAAYASTMIGDGTIGNEYRVE